MKYRLALTMVALIATTAWSAAPMRGVIEGYYGKPWSGDARRDVIAFMGFHHLNTFVYAPKNDDYHRARWREPYPADALADLRATAVLAKRRHVTFVYGLTPALDVCYSCAADRKALVRKLAQMRKARIRRFALLFDDSPATLANPADVARYGGGDAAALARAQADLVNRAGTWLRAHGAALAFMVPTNYAGTGCRPYDGALASALRHRLPIGWTGPGVFAAEITGAMARARGACTPGHPVVLWDNFPVNDTILSINLHLGPLTGRDADLAAVLAGHLLNPMTQPYASMVALGTAAAYFADPAGYAADVDTPWRDALNEVSDGTPGFTTLAEQTRSSALDLDDARPLAAALDGVDATFAGADWGPAVDALAAEIHRQADAPASIDADLPLVSPLRLEIAPWVAELAAHAARATQGVQLLRALRPGIAGLAFDGGQVAGRALPPDSATMALLGPGFVTEAADVAARIANPPLLGLVGCLGDLTGADIHFCTAYGLNVHGKALYLLVDTLEVVADRNVHDRLIRMVAATYAAWTARPPAGALAVTVDDAPAGLAPDGHFTFTGTAGHGSRVVVTTASGDSTAYVLP